MRVVFLGVAPTPAVAFLAQRGGMPAAIVSASHNPWTDNGVKLVGPDGRKLGDEAEAAIEEELRRLLSTLGGGALRGATMKRRSESTIETEESRRSAAASAALNPAAASVSRRRLRLRDGH